MKRELCVLNSVGYDICIGVVALLALGAAVHYYLKYRRRALAVPPDPPHVIAFRALD